MPLLDGKQQEGENCCEDGVMKRLKCLLFFGLAAAFVMVACSAAVSEPTEQAGKVETEPVEGSAIPTIPAVNEGEVPKPIESTSTVRDFKIVTLLPRDVISAIDDPQYYTVQEANAEYDDEEQVLGVVFDGEARAYSVAKLSRHEIVNDTVGGQAIAVTW